jgi:hypothetical protein
MPVQCICQTCGMIFFKNASAIANGRGKYCSKRCYNPVYTQICQNPTCGKTFIFNPTRLKRSAVHYCSVDCRFPERTLTGRFWNKVKRCDHDTYCIFCCWNWTAATNKQGYGVLRMHDSDGYRNILANRLVWEIINGHPLSPSLHALHHCDRPPCVNPWHIYPGTPSHNIQDAYNRGRRHTSPPNLRGEERHNARLTAQDIPVIFHLRTQGWSHQKIAVHFHVDRKTIGCVLNKTTWQHVSCTFIVESS